MTINILNYSLGFLFDILTIFTNIQLILQRQCGDEGNWSEHRPLKSMAATSMPLQLLEIYFLDNYVYLSLFK